MSILAVLILLLCGAAFTPTNATPDYGSDPSEIVYTERIIPGPCQEEPYSLWTPSSEPLPPKDDKIPYDLGAMLSGFVLCQTTEASPSADDAIQAIQGLRARLYRPAQQNSRDEPHCTDLITYKHAVVAMCGPHGTWMQSKDAGKMANQIYRFCRVEVGEKWRMGGQYVFNNNTVPKSLMQVYHVRDTKSKTGLDH